MFARFRAKRAPAILEALAAALAMAALAVACTDSPPSVKVEENTPEVCDDGIDNDGDGLTDCDDDGCAPLDVCGGGDGDTDADSDSDSDADADADSDADADTEIYPGDVTVMMYEDADNNLEQVLLDDVNEAEAAEIPENINLVVLLDRAEGYSSADGDWTGAKLFRLQHDTEMAAIGSPRLADPEFLGLSADSPNGEEIDMGSPETLEAFIDFCQQRFPADHYILHISDHGDGWRAEDELPPAHPMLLKGTCSDDSSGNSLTISHDFPSAMEGKGIAAVSFDACLLGTVEVGWAIKDHCDFFSASVMSVPGTGWEYTETLNTWFQDPTPENWVVASVVEFENYYGGEGNVGFSAVDLTAMDAFGEALSGFLAAAEEADSGALQTAKNDAFTPQWFGWDGMVDFGDFIDRCRSAVGEEVTDALLVEFESMIISMWYSENLPDVNGLSIYAPRELWGYGGYDEAYDETPFAIDTEWEDFIIPLVE
jgi:hypothetical protein